MVRGRSLSVGAHAMRVTRSRTNRLDSPDNSDDEDIDVDRIRRQLQRMPRDDFLRVIQGVGDAGQHPRPASDAVVGRYRRPATLQIPLFQARPPGREEFLSVELFLKTVRRETRIGNFDDQERIMITRDHLRGAARTKFDNTDMLDETDWATFEARMKETFGIPQEKLQNKLHELMIHRKAGEPLSDYIERISGELNNYSDTGSMADADKVIHLKRILRNTLPREMRFPLELNDDYDNLVACILAYAEGQPQARLTEEDIDREKEETTRSVRGAATAAAAVSKYLPDSKKEDDEEIPPGSQQRDQAKGSRETPGSSFRGRSHRGRGRTVPTHLRCDGCGGNHSKAVCRRSRNVTCHTCNIVGHYSYMCRKNGPRATDPFPVASPNFVPRIPQQRPWAPTHRFPMPTFGPAAPPQAGMMAPPQYPMAPTQAYQAPMTRPWPPLQRPPAPAVAAAPVQHAPQVTFPWGTPQQQQAMPPTEEQQQQQQTLM